MRSMKSATAPAWAWARRSSAPGEDSSSAFPKVSESGAWRAARFDIINLFDEVYEIRDGTGVGVGAPQFGARRGFFVGLSKAL